MYRIDETGEVSVVRLLAASLLTACLFATVAVAQTSRFEVTIQPQSSTQGFAKISVDKAALGSSQIRLWQNTSIEPDCSPRGQPTLSVIRQPEHGKVIIDDEPFFYVFAAGSGRENCSQHKVPGHRAFYTADDGYKGHDKVVLQGSQPDGYVRQITVNIDVR